MGKKRKETAKPDIDAARRVVPSGDGFSKRARMDGSGSSALSEKQTDVPVVNAPAIPVVSEDSEDVELRVPSVASAAEAGVDPATHPCSRLLGSNRFCHYL